MKMALPDISFLPPRIDRYLDMPFRLPGTNWAWLAGVLAALFQIWFPWFFTAVFIAFVLLMVLPIPFPQYSLTSFTQPLPNGRWLYLIASKKHKSDPRLHIEAIKGGIVNAGIFIGFICVIVRFVFVMLSGLQGHDILLAGKPYWPQFIASDKFYKLALYYFETPYGNDAQWHVTLYQLARWIYPIGIVWCFVIFLLYKNDLLAIKLNLDAIQKNVKAIHKGIMTVRTPLPIILPKTIRSTAIGFLIVCAPFLTILLGFQIYMLAYPDTLLGDPFSDFLVPLIGLQGFLSIVHICVSFALNFFPSVFMTMMKILRPQLMTKELSMTFD